MDEYLKLLLWRESRQIQLISANIPMSQHKSCFQFDNQDPPQNSKSKGSEFKKVWFYLIQKNMLTIRMPMWWGRYKLQREYKNYKVKLLSPDWKEKIRK